MPEDVDNIESHRPSRTGDLFDPIDNPLAEGLDGDTGARAPADDCDA